MRSLTTVYLLLTMALTTGQLYLYSQSSRTPEKAYRIAPPYTSNGPVGQRPEKVASRRN